MTPQFPKEITVTLTTAEVSAISLSMGIAKHAICLAGLDDAGHSLLHKVSSALGISDAELCCKHPAHATKTKEEWPEEIKAEGIPS